MKSGFLNELSAELRMLCFLFLICLSIGFYLGIGFVNHTTDAEPQGIIENYNGNEDNLEAEEMKFKKSEHEMLNILHTHFLSLSVIFLLLGILTYGLNINSKLRKFLMIEPMISVIFTFGGIYLVWTGVEWMTYVVILSGSLMTASYGIATLLVMINLLNRN